MSTPRPLKDKIKTLDELLHVRKELRGRGKKFVFTNGCFDLLHAGHLWTLASARSAGDALLVAINSDRSVGKLKGPHRPVVSEEERREVLAALDCVDYVAIFDEDDPGNLISRLLPDLLVKGGDWAHDAIIGREVVEKNGGRVLRVPPLPGHSSTDIIDKILKTAPSR